MGSKVGDATNRIALYFNIGAKHLADQWLQTTQFYDQKLVIS